MTERKYVPLQCSVCGKEMLIRSDYINKHSGICMSCQKKQNHNATKHGEHKTRLYRIWSGLFHRRHYKKTPNVCAEWKDYTKFRDWAMVNGYSENLTIDRIDNNGDYEPSNCQWITHKENSGKDKLIFSDKECAAVYEARKQIGLTQREMAQKLGVSRSTIRRAEKKAKGEAI